LSTSKPRKTASPLTAADGADPRKVDFAFKFGATIRAMMKKRKHFRPQAERPRERGRDRPAGGHGHWLYGHHAVAAALANPARAAHRLLVTGDAPDLPESRRITPEKATREAIGALLPDGAVHQGIALLTDPLPARHIEDYADSAPADALCVVLDQVTDPHNVGAVLRSAAVFGAGAVILPDRHAPPETGALAKAASGALESVALVRVTNLARALDTLKEAGFWCVGFDGEASDRLGERPLPEKAALVFGAEGAGMRRLTREHCDLTLAIPARGPMASLNVSNAVAVALFAAAGRGG
jgi:23S rRNA (guanosine2251-2'-O)-methyltransferase